jgi:hypothetical protein
MSSKDASDDKLIFSNCGVDPIDGEGISTGRCRCTGPEIERARCGAKVVVLREQHPRARNRCPAQRQYSINPDLGRSRSVPTGRAPVK